MKNAIAFLFFYIEKQNGSILFDFCYGDACFAFSKSA